MDNRERLQAMTTMNGPSQPVKDLSFVIIGKNAEWSIVRLLDSIIACTPPRITTEIIYADSASTDHTIEIVSRYPVRIVQLSADQPLCASAGRFIGSQHATGKYVAFIDSDMELLDGWVRDALTVLDRHADIAVVSGIQLDSYSDGRQTGQKVSGCSLDTQDRFTETRFAGSAAMFRREALDKAGTWNPFIISDEEPELCLRIRHEGYRIVELSCPSVRHYGYAPATMSALLARRKRRLFLGYGQVMRYHLRTGLLTRYLRERGWVMMPAFVGFAAVICVILSCVSESYLWILGFLGAVLLALALDAIRSRSFYKALFHMLHRALILEGTIRGFFLRPHDPSEYPRDVQLFDPACSSIEAVLSVQHTA